MESSFLKTSAERSLALTKNIETRLVADLFYHGKGVVIGTLILFVVNFSFYQPILPMPVFIVWIALILGSCVIRVVSIVRYERADGAGSTGRWHSEIVLAYVVMAAGWGLLGVSCVVSLPATQSIVAIVTVAGITGSAAATTSASPFVFRSVAYIALAPLAIAALLSSHESLLFVGAMSACYLVVLNRASGRIHETLVQNVTFGLENEDLVETLARQSTEDSLTGLSNRRALNKGFQDVWVTAIQHQHCVGLVLCDIDFFKEYNDTHGHLEGDHCLQRVADALKSATRSSDLLTARYGGEEFAVLLPDCDTKELRRISERLRAAVHSLAVPHGQSAVSPQVTISVGACHLVPEPSIDVDELIKAADRALYMAKDKGRNCVQVSSFSAYLNSTSEVS